MTPPFVSLIIPTQGLRGSLAGAVRSALAQDHPSLEVLVVDDAPSESRWRQDPAHASWQADPRVRLVPFHQGRGCAAAKNAGLRAARGQWLCYLDDDNEDRPGKVSAQLARAVATGSSLVLCGLEIRVGGRRRFRQVNRDRFEGDQLLISAVADTNVLFHRRLAGVEWDESLGTGDDACFFQACLAATGQETVPNVPQPLVVYQAHHGKRANRDWVQHYRGQRRLLVRWSRRYGRRARRTLVLRELISKWKFHPGRGMSIVPLGIRLMRVGGWREWRFAANAAGVRLPVVRRWMVT